MKIRVCVQPVLSQILINGVKANLRGAYLSTIAQDYNLQVRTEWIRFPGFIPETQTEVASSNWFNPVSYFIEVMRMFS
jgi:hypothetical protein